MFTGLVEACGRIARSESKGGDRRLTIASEDFNLHDVRLGDSICVNGVCLTAIDIESDRFCADVSQETLSRTTLGELGVGAPVNLEPSLTPTSRLGGHLVSGHVDGIGRLSSLKSDARSWRLNFEVPDALSRYIAEKGSICIDGVSLTVNGVERDRFDVNIVPHTFEKTTIGRYRVGQRVNLEVDIIARYLERLLVAGRDRTASDPADGGLLDRLLRDRGYLT